MDRDTLAFIICLIHDFARRWDILPSGAYRILRDSGCIEEYLIPEVKDIYQPEESYFLDGIIDYLKNKGIEVPENAEG